MKECLVPVCMLLMLSWRCCIGAGQRGSELCFQPECLLRYGQSWSYLHTKVYLRFANIGAGQRDFQHLTQLLFLLLFAQSFS